MKVWSKTAWILFLIYFKTIHVQADTFSLTLWNGKCDGGPSADVCSATCGLSSCTTQELSPELALSYSFKSILPQGFVIDKSNNLLLEGKLCPYEHSGELEIFLNSVLVANYIIEEEPCHTFLLNINLNETYISSAYSYLNDNYLELNAVNQTLTLTRITLNLDGRYIDPNVWLLKEYMPYSCNQTDLIIPIWIGRIINTVPCICQLTFRVSNKTSVIEGKRENITRGGYSSCSFRDLSEDFCNYIELGSPISLTFGLVPASYPPQIFLNRTMYLYRSPNITSVTPHSGRVQGGTPLTITGVGFFSSIWMLVSIGNFQCDRASFINSTTITAVTKPGILHYAECVTVAMNGQDYFPPNPDPSSCDAFFIYTNENPSVPAPIPEPQASPQIEPQPSLPPEQSPQSSIPQPSQPPKPILVPQPNIVVPEPSPAIHPQPDTPNNDIIGFFNIYWPYFGIGGAIILFFILFVIVICFLKKKKLIKSKYSPLNYIDEKLSMKPSEITMKNLIGHGSSGEVYRAVWRKTQVAVKKVPLTTSSKSVEEMMQEASIMINLRHPNVVVLMGVCIMNDHLCLVTEFLDKGSLYQVLENSKIVIELEHIRSFAMDTCKGMTYLHSSNVIHRDLKSRNLLVDTKWGIKVGDFGLSREESSTHTMTSCGSPCWAAPEVLRKQRYSFSADVFSFGVCLWEMCTRKAPYDGVPAYQIVVGVATKDLRPDLEEVESEQFSKIMQMCWEENPTSRPNFSELLEILEEMYTAAPTSPTPYYKSSPSKYQ